MPAGSDAFGNRVESFVSSIAYRRIDQKFHELKQADLLAGGFSPEDLFLCRVAEIAFC